MRWAADVELSKKRIAVSEQQLMTPIPSNRQVGLVAGFTALAWLGEYVHNIADLPGLSIFSPENSLTALISAILFVGWRLLLYRRLMTWLLIVWTVLHLVGGGVVTVIPFSFLPFYPEQSLRHYLAHVFYGAAQIPLIAVLVWQLRQSR